MVYNTSDYYVPISANSKCIILVSTGIGTEVLTTSRPGIGLATEKSSIMACTLLEGANLAALLFLLLQTTEQVLIDVQIIVKQTQMIKLCARVCKVR